MTYEDMISLQRVSLCLDAVSVLENLVMALDGGNFEIIEIVSY